MAPTCVVGIITTALRCGTQWNVSQCGASYVQTVEWGGRERLQHYNSVSWRTVVTPYVGMAPKKNGGYIKSAQMTRSKCLR